jgi:hypothetical protein
MTKNYEAMNSSVPAVVIPLLLAATTGSASAADVGLTEHHGQIVEHRSSANRYWGLVQARGEIIATPEKVANRRHLKEISHDQSRTFDRLAQRWKQETALSSRVADIAMHPAYQSIIGMGRAALPLILRDLEREPDHWFWALEAITGVNPVHAEHQGDIELMAMDWLQWGRARGIIT